MADITASVRGILRAQETRGERLIAHIRLFMGLSGLAMALAAHGINTPAANAVFFGQGIALAGWSLLVYLLLKRSGGRWIGWLKYASITFDLLVIHLIAVAALVNHFGLIEYFHSFGPIVVLIWNLLSGVRFNPRSSLYSAGLTGLVGSGILYGSVAAGLVETSPISVWGQPRINVGDESMRLFYVVAAGGVAALLAVLGRKLVLRAEAEAARRKELEQHKARLARYLSPEVAEVIVDDPTLWELGGVRREATVLFVDIRNFTAFAERNTAERVVAMLNDRFTTLTQVVFRCHGTLDKFLGDGMMVLFNVPFDQADHALRAVVCAVEMVRLLDDLPPLEDGTRIRVGAGIATGIVIAGNVGSPDRMDFTCIGDAVNLAARIQAHNAEAGTDVLLAPETARRVRDRVPVRSIGPARLKGKAEPVELFAVEVAAIDDATWRELLAACTGAEGPGPDDDPDHPGPAAALAVPGGAEGAGSAGG